jgi:hypothetical protein
LIDFVKATSPPGTYDSADASLPYLLVCINADGWLYVVIASEACCESVL